MSLVSRAPKAAADEGGPFAPASCPWDPWPGVAPDYQLKGYNDGDLISCAGCVDLADVIWDGTFEKEEGACYWRIPAAFNTINGKNLYDLMATHSVLCIHARGWQISILCWTAPATMTRIWRGYKTHGNTPVGVYKRESGCDVTATLEIEQTP